MPIAIQNRVLLGITFFVGMMLLVGWIAINEPGRMQVFTEQYAGRSIENGAAIYQNNCATCHGTDGLGVQGPGIRNPMLFLDKNPATDKQNVVKDIQTQLTTTNQQISAVADNEKKITELEIKIAAEKDATKLKTLQDDRTAAQNTLKRAQDNLEANRKKVADLTVSLDAANKELDALLAQGWEAGRLPRLKEVNWGGTLDAYIQNAVAAGRPLSGSYWGGVIMPTWGQKYGGPMRDDEVRDVTAYVVNWRDQALKTLPSEVKLQFKVPVAAGAGGPVATVDAISKKFPDIGPEKEKLALLGDLTGGDAAKGEKLYSANACAGCHLAASQGPITKGTWYRVLTDRLKVPENAGLTGEEFIAQSVLYPNQYLTPNYGAGVMPQGYKDQLTLENLKDIIAYLKTFSVP